jgi:hypothetical protein
MTKDKIKVLEAAKARIAAKIARLEKKILLQQHKQLAILPAKYGFDSVGAFLKAVKQAAGGKVGVAAGGKRRKRAVITDETRAAVKKHTEAGKTGAAIAKALDISLPSVQNIKKALGLVKPRKA